MSIINIPSKLAIRISRFIKSNKSKYYESNNRIFTFNNKVKMRSQMRMWQSKLNKAGVEAGMKIDGVQGVLAIRDDVVSIGGAIPRVLSIIGAENSYPNRG